MPIKMTKIPRNWATRGGGLTEISDSAVFLLDLVGHAEDGRDVVQGGWHDLTVEHRLSKVAGRLRPEYPPRWRLLRPSSRGSHLLQPSPPPRFTFRLPKTSDQSLIVQERTQKNETRTRNRARDYRFLPLEEDDHNDPHRLASAFTPASASPCLAIKVVIVSNPKPKETSSRTSRRLPDSFFGGRRSRIWEFHTERASEWRMWCELTLPRFSFWGKRWRGGECKKGVRKRKRHGADCEEGRVVESRPTERKTKKGTDLLIISDNATIHWLVGTVVFGWGLRFAPPSVAWRRMRCFDFVCFSSFGCRKLLFFFFSFLLPYEKRIILFVWNYLFEHLW